VGQGDSLKSVVCQPNTAFEFDAEINDFLQHDYQIVR
jgi:hypothetical protein